MIATLENTLLLFNENKRDGIKAILVRLNEGDMYWVDRRDTISKNPYILTKRLTTFDSVELTEHLEFIKNPA